MATSPIAVSVPQARPTKIPEALTRRRAEIAAQDTANATAPVPTPASTSTNTYTPALQVVPEINLPAPAPTPSNVVQLQPAPAIVPAPALTPEFDESLFYSDDPSSAASAPALVPSAPAIQQFVQPTPQPSNPLTQADPLRDELIRLQQAQLAELRAKYETLEQRLAAPTVTTPAPAPAQARVTGDVQIPAFAMPAVNVDPSIRDAMQHSLPIIQQYAEAAARSVYDSLVPVINTLSQQKQELESNFNSSMASHRQNTYANTLNMRVPDAESLLGSAHVNEFMDKPIPYSNGQTIRSRLTAANEASDVNAVTVILTDLREFIRNKEATPVHPNVTPGVVSATPQSQSGVAKSKPKLAWSKRQQAASDRRAGRITQADLDKIQALYAKAEAEGRIDFDK